MLKDFSSVQLKYRDRAVLGLNERVKITGPLGDERSVNARIDTGATKSSVDVKLAAEIKLGPILKTKVVKSASGSGMRPVVRATITIQGREIESEFTIADRDSLKFKVLIGQDILKEGFVIDPSKK